MSSWTDEEESARTVSTVGMGLGNHFFLSPTKSPRAKTYAKADSKQGLQRRLEERLYGAKLSRPAAFVAVLLIKPPPLAGVV